MSSKITENHIELMTIEVLEEQGFEYIHGPDRDRSEQETYEQVVLPIQRKQ